MRIAVTLGDPRGIGPEVAARAALSLQALPNRPELLFIGPRGTDAEAAADEFFPIGDWHAGAPTESAGALAASAIETASQLALDREVDAIVTAPIDKFALQAAGHPYPGHTEMLAALAGDQIVTMMMVAEETPLGGPLRVVLATTHIPLSAVPAALSPALFVEQAELTARGIRGGWGIEVPKIAFCAINPHASDSGLFGDEEERLLAPALERLHRNRGLEVWGPVPADTVFTRALRGEFDAVIAPYHDVGMAAFKTVSFGRGVNLTLGLPYIRTSPDHGTAFDIAGTGRADHGSMLEAILLAVRLSENRDRTPRTER